jgi:hypothetical protein
VLCFPTLSRTARRPIIRGGYETTGSLDECGIAKAIAQRPACDQSMSKIRSNVSSVKFTPISERFTILHNLKGSKKEDLLLPQDGSFRGTKAARIGNLAGCGRIGDNATVRFSAGRR